MSSAKLESIARKLRLPDAPLSAELTATIERLVNERVEAALARQPVKQPAHVQRLLDRQFNKPLNMPTDFKQLPPVPKTAPAKNISALIHRDAAGVARWMEVNGVKFEALRDGAGVLLGMRQVDESPVLPAPDIPFKAAAREYKDGV